MKLLRASGVKASPHEIFPSLAKMSAYREREFERNRGMLKSSAIANSLLARMARESVGGERLEFK